MTNSTIVVVAKDPGGSKNVVPIYKELKNMGHNAHLFTNGWASKGLENQGLEFTPVESTQEVLAKFPNPRMLVTSMCSDGGVGRDLVPLLWGRCPVVASQDYWGARLMTEWSKLKYRPDFINVNDQLGSEVVMRAWPRFAKDHIFQAGYPMFDFYADITRADEKRARDEIGEKLGIDSGAAIVFFPCGVLNGASEFLTEVLAAVRMVRSQTIKLIPRVHPRLHLNAPAEFEPWNRQLAQFEEDLPGVLVCDESVIRGDMKKLLLASDVVISDFSTTLLEAGLVGARLTGKANVSACYTPTVASCFYDELGQLMSEPPFVTLGCSVKAENQGGLSEALIRLLDCDQKLMDGLRANQKKHLKTDGLNSQRAAKLISSLL